MNNLKLITLFILGFFTTAAIAQTKSIIPADAKILWEGRKITGKHEGTINLKEGNLVFTNNKLTGGSFVVDMPTLTATDLSGSSLQKLNNHLKSDDFFGVDKYPVSKMVFKRVVDKGNGNYTITADLTIKDATNPVEFEAKITGNTATGKLVIDRTKYGIRYGSGSFFSNLGDSAIYDDFSLDISLKF